MSAIGLLKAAEEDKYHLLSILNHQHHGNGGGESYLTLEIKGLLTCVDAHEPVVALFQGKL